jgi:NADPH:quinone reductase
MAWYSSSSPAQTGFQKALVVRTVGQPVSPVWDRPIPQPGRNQVQLKVHVAGLNPHDQKVRDWGLFEDNANPAILANDVVGVVTQLGQDVGEDVYSVGDRIVLQGGLSRASLQNGLQEYCLADIGASCKIPDNISDDGAATLPTNLIAPLVALFDSLKIPAPWTSEAADFDYAGTTLLVVIDRHGGEEAVLHRIHHIIGAEDDLVYAYDSVNPPARQTLALNALSSHRRGALARLQNDGDIDETLVVGKQAGFDVRDVSGSSQLKWRLARPFWERLPGYLAEGKIRPLKFVAKQGLSAGHVNWVLDAYRDGEKVAKTHIHLT